MTRRQWRQWERDIRALHAEPGGVMRLILVTAADAFRLIGAAALSDAAALSYLQALDRFRRRIASAAGDASLCLTCDRMLGGDTPLIALVIPARDDASRWLAVGPCPACTARYRDRSEAAAAIGAALRMLWPGVRPIAPPSGASGRA